MAKLRIVFMGTGDIALPSLRSLLVADDGAQSNSNSKSNPNSEPASYELVALVTQPDKPVGRKQVLTAPAIKELAQAHGIPVMQPESAREKSFLKALKADGARCDCGDGLWPDLVAGAARYCICCLY